jgi:two-component system, sensor histidine kinase and response regulator
MDIDKPDKKKQPLILIAEDIPRNMEIVCNILKKSGYRFAMAGNGKQAVEMAPLVNPDLILMDVMMPEMNGFEACEILKKDPILKEIPIIFLTAKADTMDIVKGFEIGAVDYVTKPFKGTELLSRVRTHLELKLSREELKELNATKDKFFSIIAHDLKDPLQYLLLAADTLVNDYDSFDEIKRKDYIRRFHNNSQQLSSLLENLLTWSRSQRGLMKRKPEKLDIAALVAESMRLLSENAEKKEIHLSSQVEHGTSAFADKNMIRTIFRNLISNAVKFSHPSSEVIVSASPAMPLEPVKITVTDHGIGIDEENLDGLFRLDMKKSTMGTAKEKGTGLGLILCKEFIEKNKGTITVTSQLGKGSAFTFTLPEKGNPTADK